MITNAPPSARERALDAALDLVRADRPISLEIAAAEAGLSEPGPVHHSCTKEALVVALVDHVADRSELALAATSTRATS